MSFVSKNCFRFKGQVEICGETPYTSFSFEVDKFHSLSLPSTSVHWFNKKTQFLKALPLFDKVAWRSLIMLFNLFIR